MNGYCIDIVFVRKLESSESSESCFLEIQSFSPKKNVSEKSQQNLHRKGEEIEDTVQHLFLLHQLKRIRIIQRGKTLEE